MFWKSFRDQAVGLSDLLRYCVMVADGVMQGKGGELIGGFYYKGSDLESASVEEINTIMARINHMLTKFGNGWMVHCDAIRDEAVGYPVQGAFPDAVTRLIDEERRQHYNSEQGHFQSAYAIVLTYLPPSRLEARGQEWLYETTGAERDVSDKTLADSTVLKFERAMLDVEGTLTGVFAGLRRMRSYVARKPRNVLESPVVFDELLTHLCFCVTGVPQPVRLPAVPMYLDTLIGSADFVGGFEPKIGRNHIKVIAIEGFPAGGESYPGMLDVLNHLPVTYRFSTRFIFLDPEEAREMMDTLRKKWRQKTRGLADQVFNTANGAVDLDALEMMEDSQRAMAEASSQIVRFGHYTATVILMDRDKQKVNDAVDMVEKSISAQGFKTRIETVNAIEAFLGSLPGHGFENVRRPIIHTLNLAHLLPTTSQWAGPAVNSCPFYPKNSPPLLYGRGAGSTPFRLSLHVQDVGHAMILGPTGSGKSTLLNLIIAQQRRYPRAKIFGFDKKMGSFPLVKGAGADHYHIGASDCTLKFCPLRHIDKKSERIWAADWVEVLISLNGVEVSPEHRSTIAKALESMADPKNTRGRTMTNLWSAIQDETLKAALEPYKTGGQVGDLLDGEEDNLLDGNFQVFEMEHLMNMQERNAVPVLLYLFHRIEGRLDGSPVTIVLDEAWLMFKNPLFAAKLEEWLLVLRSANSNVIFATQLVEHVAQSPIAPVLFQSCPTRILLPNPEAKHEMTRETYLKMGLTERQIDLIATATPKRDYYYTSPEGRRLFQLELGPMALAFVGRSGKEDIAKIKELEATHGFNRWQGEWLRYLGLPGWADRWEHETAAERAQYDLEAA